MGGHTTSARVAARRRAQEIKVRRQAVAAQREEKVCAALARFYEARMNAARHEEEAAGVVRELHELLGSAETAAVCGITTAAVRSMIAPGTAAGAYARASEQMGAVPGEGQDDETGGLPVPRRDR